VTNRTHGSREQGHASFLSILIVWVINFHPKMDHLYLSFRHIGLELVFFPLKNTIFRYQNRYHVGTSLNNHWFEPPGGRGQLCDRQMKLQMPLLELT
jgi:hypothetical protein